jgi:hypothetical protein
VAKVKEFTTAVLHEQTLPMMPAAADSVVAALAEPMPRGHPGREPRLAAECHGFRVRGIANSFADRPASSADRFTRDEPPSGMLRHMRSFIRSRVCGTKSPWIQVGRASNDLLTPHS